MSAAKNTNPQSPLRELLKKIQRINDDTCERPEGRDYHAIRKLIEAEQESEQFIPELTVLLSVVADGCLPIFD